MRLVGFPICFDTPSPIRGLPAVESVAPSILSRAFGERQSIIACVNHDRKKVLASTADGSLVLRVERDGLRASFDLADSVAGNQVLTAWADGRITGGSFAFKPSDGLWVRWHTAESPWRREIRSALVDEVTVAVAPARPFYADTWQCMQSPALRLLSERLDAQRGIRRRVLESPPPADLVLTGKIPLILAVFGADRILIENEYAAVREALAAHPGAKTIDVKYARTVKSARRRTRMHERDIMGELETRPSGGAAGVASALRSMEKYRKEFQARERARPRRGGLTIDEARKRMKKSMGS